MGYIVCLSILVLNFLVSRLMSRNILFPASLFSIIWLLVITVHFLCSEYEYLGIRPLSKDTLTIFSLGTCCFTLGAMVSSLYFKSRQRLAKIYYNEINYNISFERIIVAVAVIFLPLYAYESYLIATSNPISGNWFMDLRLNVNSGEAERKYIYGTVFANFAFFLYLYKFYSGKDRNLKMLYFTAVLLLAYIVLSTGRTTIMQVFLLILGVISIFKRVKIRYIIFALLGFIALFFVYGIALQKGASEGNTFVENLHSLSENVVMYFIGGPSAFDQVFNRGIPSYEETRTFRLIASLLYKFGFTANPPQGLVENFVMVPFPTNVYTCYYVYIQDFGVGYAFFVLLVQAFSHTMFYYKAITPGRYRVQFVFLYSMLLFPLVMSFFHDQFITLLANWIYIFVLTAITRKYIFYKSSFS